jgi:hypothetical protein
MVLGEAFIALGWIDPLLGLYPVLRDRYIWLVRAGLVFAVIGLIAFVYLTAASVFATLQGMEITDIPIPIAVFLPGIIAGSLLAFVCFSVASLRSDAHSRTLGILMLVPSRIYVTNFVVSPAIRGPGPNSRERLRHHGGARRGDVTIATFFGPNRLRLSAARQPYRQLLSDRLALCIQQVR